MRAYRVILWSAITAVAWIGAPRQASADVLYYGLGTSFNNAAFGLLFEVNVPAADLYTGTGFTVSSHDVTVIYNRYDPATGTYTGIQEAVFDESTTIQSLTGAHLDIGHIDTYTAGPTGLVEYPGFYIDFSSIPGQSQITEQTGPMNFSFPAIGNVDFLGVPEPSPVVLVATAALLGLGGSWLRRRIEARRPVPSR